ncbi:glutaredoxin family protein [Deinococcus cellulosilyticus]|uniref:NrdH-redoxin n=1 Tax=Deinococcus cellulosilyticus (strain DSM 18568 / NBRC 106333 / KACC 11606 / 5516J-15) TaxID=1223518 RepID=A0A511NAH8_DEIC1|nr:glutaredoxin family protein [Deinococcus cellulosilyticus]GEM49546.1 NrdH-redoxin [Deinococcus cellulosilyticus NBRC 106333 = KACC 11606]
MDTPVTVYTTPHCPSCHAVKTYLTQKGIAFTEKDVTQSEAALQEMKGISGVRIAPVTQIGDEAFYGDFPVQRPHIDQALKKLGLL